MIYFSFQGEFGFQGAGGANLKIVDRPVTKGGLAGINAKPMAGGRAVQDKGYFNMLLRTKYSEIQQEIQIFKDKMEKISADNTTHNTLQTR